MVVAVERVVTWQQPFERVEQIVIRAVAGLQQRQPAGGVPGENRYQAVAALGAEGGNVRREIDDAPRRCVDGQFDTFHAS